jgi:glycerol-3-phosphate responsive antiterminator
MVNQEIDFEAVQLWLRQQQLNIDQFDQLLQEQTRIISYFDTMHSSEIKEIIDYLKISGKYQTVMSDIIRTINENDSTNEVLSTSNSRENNNITITR